MPSMTKISPREHQGSARRASAKRRLGQLGIALAAAVACTPPEPQVPSEPQPAPADEGWEEFSDPASGVGFRYPPDLGTDYIHVVDWPPQVRVEAGPFTCREAGAETARAGRTEPVTIDGRSYCVTRVTEGAAGSIYTMYAYAMPADDAVFILTFSLRAVQCGNYDEPQRSECERERAAFSVDPVVDQIARTLTATSP